MRHDEGQQPSVPDVPHHLDRRVRVGRIDVKVVALAGAELWDISLETIYCIHTGGSLHRRKTERFG